MEAPAGAAWPPGTGEDPVLRALLAVSADGLAVVDGRPGSLQGRLRALNAGAAQILGSPAVDLLGTAVPFELSAGDPDLPDRRRVVWAAPGGSRRYLEYRTLLVEPGRWAVWFSDVTGTVRQQERLTAITRAASSVADAYSLRATLDAVAREIAMTASIAAVQILTLDDPQEELRLLGMAGFGDTSDFAERLSACRRLGARVLFMEALERREAIVSLHRKPVIMADPLWAPLHAIMDAPDWDSFVSMPLVVRGRTLGIINAYYAPGEDPGPGSLAFLEAMADHAAVAIDTAALLAQTRSRAQSDERRRLARDLHDSVVQQVFSMRMQAEALRAQLDAPDPDPARVRSGAEELSSLAATALADLRGLVFELRPLDLAENGLVEAVRAHAAGVEARTRLVVEVQAPDDLELDVDVDVQEDLYRIVQEALHNVVKHARATEVDVRIARPAHGGGLQVEVVDNGCGGDPGTDPAPRRGASQGSLGLVSMRERAERWGGRLRAGPRPFGGWRVEVVLPAPGGGRGTERRTGR
ncbi:GAF domain-containing sensor histidine kinase [Geodermatophilus ruber]|uniref:PAS domain-containing sensor histidine kinase n=1 Tax=Geodermatophilus ruber TaxID=504800 RepID=UPI001C42E98B|nr:GAF domain-containing sensor histidine kinase [Geodermatophilus ruber]